MSFIRSNTMIIEGRVVWTTSALRLDGRTVDKLILSQLGITKRGWVAMTSDRYFGKAVTDVRYL